jgi:TorA maturation chaperone TorD
VREIAEQFQELEGNPQVAAGLRLVQAAESGGDEEVYDYNDLFVGPKKLLAPPYESAYRNGEKTLMQRETLAVRAFYGKAGLESCYKNVIPDDHIAMELEFVCYLLSQAGRSAEQGENEKTEVYLGLYHEFFHSHLGCWAYAHCEDICRYAKTSALQGIALLTMGFLQIEKDNPIILSSGL